MKITKVYTEEDIAMTYKIIQLKEISFTEKAIIEKFIKSLSLPRKAVLLDDCKEFIEKVIELVAGEEE